MDTSDGPGKRPTESDDTTQQTLEKKQKTAATTSETTTSNNNADLPVLTAGPLGEDIIDLGGAGDCGWRAAAAAMAFANGKNSTYINNRLTGMAITARHKGNNMATSQPKRMATLLGTGSQCHHHHRIRTSPYHCQRMA